MKKMKTYNKEEAEIFTLEVGLAIINLSSCIGFVIMQDINDKSNYELTKLRKVRQILKNLVEDLEGCIKLDTTVYVCEPDYDLVKMWQDLNLETYKLYYKNKGEF